MFDGITVVVPVGPAPHHQKYLLEALDSVIVQTLKPTAISIIDDMADITPAQHRRVSDIDMVVSRNHWRLGVASSFNVGVALSKTDLVFLMGADDVLEPECLERCWEAWRDDQFEWKELTAYCPTIRYMDTLEEQTLPCGVMMVTKQLWRHTGGFPIEAFTASDSMLHSIMLAHHDAGRVVQMGGAPLYNVRRHAEQDTARFGHPGWQRAIFDVRDRVTAEWKPAAWGRFDG